MKARLAYLTTPQVGMYVLNVQPEGSDDLLRFEISKGHLANIIVDGASLALRETSIHRVPFNPTESGVNHERATSGA